MPGWTTAPKSKTSTEVRVAYIAGCFGIVVALVTGLFGLAKKDPPPNAAPPPIVVTNHINVPNTVAPAPPLESGKLELQLFTLNEEDSLYALCSSDCGAGNWRHSGPFWAPKPEARMALNLKEGVDMWGDAGVPVGDKRYVGFERKFRANSDHYLNRLLPTFDLVVTNSSRQPAILTAFELVVLHASPYAQGDGEDRASASHLLPVLHRYELRIPEKYAEYERPFRFSVPATPPLSIQTNDPARFQISIDTAAPVAWVYEMRIKLHFGPSRTLTTEKFGLKL